MPKIEVKEVKKSFVWGEEKIEVLKGISLSIQDKEFISIVGESGSGKTTLLNILGALERPDSGTVYMDEEDIFNFSPEKTAEFRNKKMGFIFQIYNLLQDFTVLENVMLPYYIQTQNKKEAIVKAKTILGELGLTHRLTYYPARLSGGEQQRVAIARALINNPQLILSDEPTGNLDKANREKVMQILLDLKKKVGFTLIMVTHDKEIAKMADRMIRLNYGILEEVV